MSKFQKDFRKNRDLDKTRLRKRRRRRRRRWNYFECFGAFEALISVITLIAIASLERAPQVTQVEALHITSFRVPSYVPITLPLNSQQQQQQQQTSFQRHPLDLAKPILLDCDYDFKPDEDTRLTVRWFKNKEAEPFYQWLPELNVRHFADWIKPLVNQSFVSDPHDPMKRYRSLLIRRLSMNLTAQYSCLVSSLASQDMRQASLVVYQPPKSFTFEHHIYPLPPMISEAASLNYNRNSINDNNSFGIGSASPSSSSRQAQNGFARTHPAAGSGHFQSPYLHFNNLSQVRKVESPTTTARQQLESESESVGWKARPTQFKGYGNNKAIVRPPNNNSSMLTALTTTTSSTTIVPPTVLSNTEGGEKIVYTHDGRPVRRKQQSKRQLNLPNSSNSMIFSNRRRQEQAPLFDSTATTSIPVGEESQAYPGYGMPHGKSSSLSINTISSKQILPSQATKWAIQLHHFQCQAMQVTPRPVIVLTVKRDTDSIAQYLHESSSVSIRPYQVSQSEYYLEMLAKGNSHVDLPPTNNHQAGPGASKVISSEHHHYLARQSTQQPKQKEDEQLLVTLYDITVSATVALNVSLPATYSSTSKLKGELLETSSGPGATSSAIDDPLGNDWLSNREAVDLQHGQQMGINTVLSFRRNQRMSFECHLEITGTEFEQRKRINIKEEEVFQFALREEERRRMKLSQKQANGLDKGQESSGSSSLDFTSSSAAAIATSYYNQLILEFPASGYILIRTCSSLTIVLFLTKMFYQ